MTIVVAVACVVMVAAWGLIYWEFVKEHGVRRLYFTHRGDPYVAAYRTIDLDGHPIQAPVWTIARTTDKSWQWTADPSPFPEPEAAIITRLQAAIDGQPWPVLRPPVPIIHRPSRAVYHGPRRWWE